MTDVASDQLEGLGRYKFGWADPDQAGAVAQRGLSEEVVRNISALKNEPEWMLDMRLKGLRLFEKKPMPGWGADLSGIDFDNIKYFVRSTEKQAASWDDLPADIKNTYDKLGIPEAEKQRLVAGVAAQYECISAGALVWTANRGRVPVKEIEPGDMVFALDEETGHFVVAPVKAAAQTGVEQTYQVTVGTRSIRATANHPFLTLSDDRRAGSKRARYVRRWKTVSELRAGDLVAVPRDLPEFGESMPLPKPVGRWGEQLGPETTNVDLMWLLGFYLGDGSLQSAGRTHRVQFAVPATDVEIRAEIARVVAEQFGLRVIEADDVRVVVNSRALVQWMQVMGFWGTSHSKEVPPWVFRLPLDQRLAFLGGWIDADGYVPLGRSSCVRLTSVSAPLLEQAADLARLAGIRVGGPHEFSGKHPFDPERVMYGQRLTMTGPLERLGCRNPKRLARLGMGAYAHTYTSVRGRKFAQYCTDHVGFAQITSIEPYEIEPVFDIEVDGPHNFIAEGLVVHNSEVVYHQIREDLEQQGVIFVDTDTGLREHEDLFREHFASVIPTGDNKFSALNTAVWSGGSFIYVPKGVHVDIPLQAYFRINTENMGQFERTLIIADEGSYVHYVEGCLPAGELITTADGDLRPIESIRVGDRVLGHDGRSHRVTATQMRDLNGSLHRFTPMSPANAFRVTDEHPLLVVRRSDVLVKRAPRNGWQPEVDTKKLVASTPQWVAAKDVAPGDFLVYPKPRREPASVVLPLEFARLAGYYLAEGHATLTNGCESLCFSFHIDEHDYVDEVRRATKELYDAEGSVLYEEDKHSARVLVYTKAGYAALTHHVGTGSSMKQLSADLMSQDDEFLRELVRCYMNGDGNTVSRGGAIWKRAHTTSRVWAFQLQSILARLGVFATVEMCRPGGPGEILGRQVVRQDLYQVRWTEEGRGPKQARDCGDYFLVPIRSKESREAHEPVFNLDVEAPDSYLAYGFAVHNCTAPIYSSDSLHSAVVEIVVKKDARVRYTTIQNWSNNVYNLVTKRAMAHEGATMEWVDGNLGSKVTMKYPAVWMVGEHAKGETLSIAFAGEGQHQDAGSKMVHAAPNTSSNIVSKSVARGGGRTSYRGLVQINKNAHHSKSTVKCDALLVDNISRSDTYPYVDVREDDVQMGHEATVSKISADQLFYLMSRGIAEEEAMAMIVRGFIEPIARELPMEYALELNRLIELQMEGAVG
ncbi:MAG TPA: Fe-S cluster assembly protein SufB [Mycobacteriales bacterium]|nr:Fe-S cluster assembly protein SufB [Mycobacteriales bacterium]